MTSLTISSFRTNLHEFKHFVECKAALHPIVAIAMAIFPLFVVVAFCVWKYRNVYAIDTSTTGEKINRISAPLIQSNGSKNANKALAVILPGVFLATTAIMGYICLRAFKKRLNIENAPIEYPSLIERVVEPICETTHLDGMQADLIKKMSVGIFGFGWFLQYAQIVYNTKMAPKEVEEGGFSNYVIDMQKARTAYNVIAASAISSVALTYSALSIPNKMLDAYPHLQIVRPIELLAKMITFPLFPGMFTLLLHNFSNISTEIQRKSIKESLTKTALSTSVLFILNFLYSSIPSEFNPSKAVMFNACVIHGVLSSQIPKMNATGKITGLALAALSVFSSKVLVNNSSKEIFSGAVCFLAAGSFADCVINAYHSITNESTAEKTYDLHDTKVDAGVSI